MDGWNTKIVPFTGGLISNKSPYQQGFNNPGSARILINYEPSIKGGYRRISGYQKALADPVPFYGEMYVQGSGQTGTTLVVGAVIADITAGSTFSIAGVTGVYTVDSVVLNPADATATITLDVPLDSSPADSALVTFLTADTNTIGLSYFDGDVIVCRGGAVFKNTSPITLSTPSPDGWTQISKPYIGDNVTVNGAGQTGNTLAIAGCTYAPTEEMFIQVGGVEETYRILSVTKTATGEYTLTLGHNLASSPVDTAAVSFVGYKSRAEDNAGRVGLDTAEYSIATDKYLLCATGSKYPFQIKNDGTFYVFSEINSDAQYAVTVAYSRGTVFWGKDDKVIFSAPANAYDYTPALGAGLISVGAEIVKLILFREQLIIFSTGRIQTIVGISAADFQLKPITYDLGCIQADTIREVGSDVMFLGPDGLRLLGATDRIGDFNLDPVAANIQNAVKNLTTTYANAKITSVVIRGKSQYRIFAHGSDLINGKGLIGANVVSPEGQLGWSWSELDDMEVTHADSGLNGNLEFVLFTNPTGYVYFMDQGTSFDGSNIKATFATPYIPFDDPEVRKTMYKMFLYIDPEGSVDITSSMKFDFDDPDAILPSSRTISMSNSATAPASYGSLTAAYGVAQYGGSLRAVFKSQLVGSAFAISFFFQSDDTNPPYTLDTMTLEYAMRGRR